MNLNVPLQKSALSGLLLAALLLLPQTRAQEAFAYKLGAAGPPGVPVENETLSAVASPSPTAITLQWRPQPAEKVTIHRRLLGTTNWTVLASNETGPTYADTQVALAARYEYRVGDRYLQSAVQAAPVEDRGRVILLVDETVASPLKTELAQLTEDLVGDGWKVVRHDVPRYDDTDWKKDPEKITRIKALVVADYNEAPAATKAVYLLGRVPIPYSGMVNPDGHGWRTWPVDGFYGDTVTEKPWTDVDNNAYSSPPNVPGDGKYDQSNYPTPVELAVGRVDFAYLPAFAKNLPAGTKPATEVDLLRRYLNKVHRYRLKQTRYADIAVAGGYYVGPSAPLNKLIYGNAVRNGTRCFGSNPAQIEEGDLFTQKSPILWGFQCGHGHIDRINDGAQNIHTTSQMADPAREPAVAFYILDGSFFGDWNQENSLIRAVLATPNYGLGSFWARNHPARFEPTGLGETVGVGWQRSINELVGEKYLTTIFLAWLGDPTLRLQIVSPPGQLTGRRSANNQVTLNWSRAEESAARYWIYRSARGLDGPFQKLNEQAIEASLFVDGSAPGGNKLYQVRTVVLTTTGSGSFTNLSQAAFVSVK